MPRFRAVPTFLEPCFLARNSASLPAYMLCSEQCFFACFYARNTASSYAQLGTLLPPMLSSEHCFLLCSARNTALLLCLRHSQNSQVPSYTIFLKTCSFHFRCRQLSALNLKKHCNLTEKNSSFIEINFCFKF